MTTTALHPTTTEEMPHPVYGRIRVRVEHTALADATGRGANRYMICVDKPDPRGGWMPTPLSTIALGEAARDTMLGAMRAKLATLTTTTVKED